MVSQEKMEEIKGNVAKTLATMLDYLGLEASLKVEEKGSRLAVLISSEEAGRIIGRKGQTLDGLQLLLNRMMFNADTDCPKISLDIDGYSRKSGKHFSERENGESSDDEQTEHKREHRESRDPRRQEHKPRERRERSGSDRDGRREYSGNDRDGRRERSGSDREERYPQRDSSHNIEEDSETHEINLQNQAQDAAKEVKRWGEPVVLPKMNSHDRRIIHITLQDDPEITTASEGEGTLKNVIIAAKK
jgi:spoIIIJ-associated protein